MEISVEEMSKRIEDYCYGIRCSSCPLNFMKESTCYVGLPDDIVRRNYNILFGSEPSPSRGERSKIVLVRDNFTPTSKNKHPFNSTEIISIKRKKNKLFLRYVDKNGKVFKTSASCHKDDEFNIVEGLKVLTDKLDEKIDNEVETKKEPFAFVVLYDNYCMNLTKGKIYRSNDGKITYDNGFTGSSYDNFEDYIKHNLGYKDLVLQIKED